MAGEISVCPARYAGLGPHRCQGGDQWSRALTTPISVVVITLNEERNIARCLESVSWAAETIVVDAHSTDGTRDRAAALGARVVDRDWPGYGPQKNFAVSLARNSWILNIDADEQVTPELALEIAEAVQNEKYKG